MAERSFADSSKRETYVAPQKQPRQYDLFTLATTISIISMLFSIVGIFLAIVL